jgi:hypothetical protein
MSIHRCARASTAWQQQRANQVLKSTPCSAFIRSCKNTRALTFQCCFLFFFLGKLGAIIGASAFAPTARIYGLSATFGCCAVFALLGLGVTVFFVPDMRKEEDGVAVLHPKGPPEVHRRL